MELKNKLKKLRTSHGMTQEEVGEHLGVSSQTVSKWERGLLCPDIALLPQIALLFKCSIDSLFDMDLVWSIEHRKEFETRISELYKKGDWEGVYQALIREIELNPDNYSNYSTIMLHVWSKKLYDGDRVETMISLAEHAEKCCTDDDKRNEIYRVMLGICSESKDPVIKEKGKYYYKKLPSLRHSREVYAIYVMEDEEYREQILKNLIFEIDLAECSVRQLILPDMPSNEKLFYYQKAAALYEVVLDGKYAGFYDTPLLFDYAEIAIISAEIGQTDTAEKYIDRIESVLEKHISGADDENKSKLLHSASVRGVAATEKMCKGVLQRLLNAPKLEGFKERILNFQKRYCEYVSSKGGKTDEG